METPHFYDIDVKWDKDRKGLMCAPQLKIAAATNACIEVATPPEFPKGISGIWSPEHLFTAAVSSCFMTTFLAIADHSKLNFSAFSCRASGKLEESEGVLMMTEITLHPEVTILDEKQREKAMRVLQKTENACLITNSIKSKVTMNPVVTFGLYQ